jgi:D-hydantoinase
MPVDIVIKNCKVVRSDNVLSAGIAIDNGKIVAVAGDTHLPKADKTINAKGNYVLPGLIDPHVHLGLLVPFDKDFKTETQSAAGGGVTTIIHLLIEKGSYKETFEKNKKIGEKNSTVDFAYHAWIMSDQHLKEIPDCVNLGVSSFKFFMAYKGAEGEQLGIASQDDGVLYFGFRKIAEIGFPALPMIHAENSEIIHRFKLDLMEKGRTDLAAWTDARPNFCEEEPMRRAIFLAKMARSPLYIVHMTIAEGVDLVAKAKAEGQRVIAETCPHYLTLTKYDKKIGVLGKVNPPLRDKASIERLWWGIQKGIVDCIGSDHVTEMSEIKKGKGDIWSAFPGFPGMETILPVMLSEGVNKRRITINKLVEVCSTNTAKIFGLWPRKGTIDIGSDADLVIVNLKKTVTVKPEILHSASDFTLYDGWKLKGWPTLTMVEGNIVMEDGEITGKPGTGKYIPCKKAR